MASRITLKEIEALLKKGKVDGELLKDVDAVMGAIQFFAPMAAGLPPGTIDVIASVFGSRDSLIKAGERLIARLSGVGSGSEVDRYRAIESAHVLVCYSAFFDAVAEEIPGFWKALSLQQADQMGLTRSARETTAHPLPPAPAIQHPLTGFQAQLGELRLFYLALDETVRRYLEVLRIPDIKAASKSGQYARIKDVIVDRALERYQAQYVELAKTFPEFHIYATFHFQREMDDRIRGLADAAAQSKRDSDTGFTRLATAIERIGRAPASQALDDLRRVYQSHIEQPILPKPVLGLTFPRRCDIFIPQAYRAIRYRTGMRLDLDETWKDCPVQEDLGPFLARCLESPHTIDKPILILGQPGSGKSMLTHMIGAIFAGRFDTVRVELRSVPADATIHTQVEHYVSLETQGRRVSWPDLRDQFTAAPVVILDGLDELLQATGRVFAAYLENCADFQSLSLTHNRPVRTIVTSRIALIGRTHVPDDTIVIRLEEFDDSRRRRWVDIWNQNNAAYFGNAANQTQPFAIEPLHPELQSMSRQPLLLLLLAIYDADRNPTRKTDLNRTALYHNIVRSFVQREEERDPVFRNLPSDEQTERVDTEMRRLAVAALAMFNHRTREITRDQVDRALEAFGMTYPADVPGQPLGQAERLFGRFFFVLKAETRAAIGGATYEFLHATFGEFLAAYLIAWRIVDTCESIAAQKPLARRDYVRKPDAFPNTWFECLMHAPLFTEPLILELLEEWLPQAAGDKLDDVKSQLRALVTGQAAMLLEGDRFPHVFKTLPALAHAAIYSVNLVTIAAVANESLIFDEQAFRVYPDQTRPWDRLTHLWRSWFSTTQLAALGSLLWSRRDGHTIKITALYAAIGVGDNMHRVLAAARAVGDRVLQGLSGYFVADTIDGQGPTLESIDRMLASEGYSIEEFTNFRRVPIEHSLQAQTQLLSIVNTHEVRNVEILARAMWMLTSEPNRFIEWKAIPIVREMPPHFIEPLIARTIGPSDCAALYSEHGKSPQQLLFARRAGGEAVYRKTYERILAAEPEKGWTPEETLIVYEAACHLKDHDTEARLRGIVDRHLTFPKLLASGKGVDGYWIRQTASALGRWQQGEIGVAKPLNMNPFWPGATEALRAVRRTYGARFAALNGEALSLLTNCLDLPIDMEIELLDIVREAEEHRPSDLKESLKLSAERLRQASLESYPAARHVAEWLNDDEAIAILDRLVRK